ncbi:MAG: sigma-70 family RNA polymerase sigma factor [Armatimonadetes bacterium]|nr:sigma-70 family RNA polymerase sigma factor [Armatimonadota bacterium]
MDDSENGISGDDRSGRPPEDDRERELVAQAQEGSLEAFSALVDVHHAGVYRIAYRMCGAQDATDLTQEIFLRALRALRRFQYQGEASFRTWLHRIAVNACINEIRRRKRRNLVEGPSLDEDIEGEDGPMERVVPDETQSPHVLAERTAVQRAVRKIVAEMSPKHRAVLTLVDLEGCNYEEAAAALGCPVGTLKSRLARARKRFAYKWQRYENGDLSLDE